jgi:hypothetical protein
MKRIAGTLLVCFALTGCLATGHLYPVGGPLSSQSPIPTYTVSLAAPPGYLTTTLADGETCKGSSVQVAPTDPSARDHAADWDTVYGAGFFQAHVLGNPALERGALTGAKGTCLEFELYMSRPGQVTSIKGVAKDDKGNVFKLTF